MKTRPLTAYEIKVLRRVLLWFHHLEHSQRRFEKECPKREREEAKLALRYSELAQHAQKNMASMDRLLSRLQAS